MKPYLTKLGMAFGIAIFLTTLYLFLPQTFFSLDHRLRDFMFLVRGELPKHKQVVIIDIDNHSLKTIGQWPWSRDTVAILIDRLKEAKAGIIGLDMVFAEEDRTSPHLLKKKFPQIDQLLPNNDQILASAFAAAPVVGGYVFTDTKTQEDRTPLIPAVFIQRGKQGTSTLSQAKGIILNTPLLQEALYSSGFFNTQQNEGGVIRSAPLLYQYQDITYPSLALEMLRIYSGAEEVDILSDEEGITDISFGAYTVPIGGSGEFMINFRGAKKHFSYLSASDVIAQDFDPKAIEGKFVLVGTSASGLKDLRAIPFDSTYPGVEVHANIIDNILSGDFIQRPLVATLYDIVLIWALVFGLMFLFALFGSWLLIPVSILFFGLLLFGLYVALFSYGLILTLLTPILAFIMTLLFSLILDYLLASKQREEVKRILGKKVSASVMQELLDHTDEGLMEPREIEATVLFSDIKGFTGIAEKVGSPKKLIQMLNLYMTPMADTIMAHQGTIDKFIGDAIMAYWNAPMPVRNHADLAVKSAIIQIEKLNAVNDVVTPRFGITLEIGIGLHTGLVTAGEMGSAGRSDYTVIGDNVNLASRLEGLTRLYGVEILISEETYRQLKGTYNTRLLDTVEVKGKTQAVKVYQLFSDDSLLPQAELSSHQRALRHFQNGEVDKALTAFVSLEQHNPSPLYKHFITRCQSFIKDDTVPFTPVLRMSHK